MRMPSPGFRQRDIRLGIRLFDCARDSDQQPPYDRIEFPPAPAVRLAESRPPPSPIRHHRRPIPRLDDGNVTRENPAIPLRQPPGKLTHQIHHAACPDIVFFNPWKPFVMTQRKIDLLAADSRQAIEMGPVKTPRCGIASRQPGAVAKYVEPKLFAKQLVVGLELFGVSGQFQLMKVELLLPVRRPTSDVAGVERACEFPGPHLSSPATAQGVENSSGPVVIGSRVSFPPIPLHSGALRQAVRVPTHVRKHRVRRSRADRAVFASSAVLRYTRRTGSVHRSWNPRCRKCRSWPILVSANPGYRRMDRDTLLAGLCRS